MRAKEETKLLIYQFIDYQPLAIDLLNPSPEHEKRSHKLKRLVQSPNSYVMDVKCPGASILPRFNRS